ncbi:hypothetical protein PYW08_004642 [Mythimna loreyi]|uniref:Uncharacterized protein n=1 Tax=Mythimna loreyi TaxID=667449 RepID=A0ACC2QQF9_9NEOP|nr:hypothetical protein PYW08_004642 [Mythimna loreyi]
MFTYKAFLFLLILNEVKSEMDLKTICRNDYRNMNNDKINVLKYCSHNICIEKCCGEGEILDMYSKCISAKVLLNVNERIAKLYKDVDYSKIALYSWNGHDTQKSNKTIVFIRNSRDIQNCTSEHDAANNYFVIEDGSLRMQDTTESKLWWDIKRLEYCVDFKIVPVDKQPAVKLVVREYIADSEDDDKKSVFVLIGLLISSFFLVLVLVVYCLLPKLQNLIGRVLMAYTLSILVTFLLKIIIHLGKESFETSKPCKTLTPMLYFAALSSFFWLNVMSFDVWWSLRGHRKRRDINRRGELVKFLWYCLYAWGTPLLITAIVTTLDNIKLENLNIYKPPFSDCFVNDDGVQYYFFIPIGVIIFVNIILFLLTVYNIWMIKRAVQRCQDSRSSKQDANRFATYFKLSVIMGVSWCLELVPSNTPLWIFILTNTYNLFIGVAIFFLFVFNKKILSMLCKRFNVNNRFTERLEVSQTTKSSGGTRPTKTYTKDQSYEMEHLNDCPNGTT